VPARCAKPPGRSLEPHSNVRPRGMAVPPQGGQNSAYRSGCLIINGLRRVHQKPCQNLATPLSSGPKENSENGNFELGEIL